MKLYDAFLRVECDTLLERGSEMCPCCLNSIIVPLTEWLAPLNTRAEIELVRAIARTSEVS